MRTIRVTGKGELRVHPDMTRITMELTGKQKEYADALRRSAEDTEAVQKTLEQLGFDRSELKTLDLSIDMQYESYRDKKGEFKRRFAGYKYSHSVKLEFASDNDRLGKILYALAQCAAEPEFRISYTVRDAEAVKNTVLEKAVSDAREKAAALAKAAGIRLLEIQTISYSWLDISLENTVCESMALPCPSTPAFARFDMDIEPGRHRGFR